MNYIIDILLLAIIAVTCIIAYKKGFFATLLEMVGSLISLFISVKLSDYLSGLLYNSLIKSRIIKTVEEKLTTASSTTVETISESIPQFIINAAKTVGIDIDAVLNANASNSDLSVVAENISNSIIEPIILLLVKIILLIILFTVLSILIKLLVKLFKKVNKIPLLGKFNKVLGLLLGVINGSLVVVVICFILGGLVRICGGEFLIFTQDILNKSYLFKLIDNINPFF